MRRSLDVTGITSQVGDNRKARNTSSSGKSKETLLDELDWNDKKRLSELAMLETVVPSKEKILRATNYVILIRPLEGHRIAVSTNQAEALMLEVWTSTLLSCLLANAETTLVFKSTIVAINPG